MEKKQKQANNPSKTPKKSQIQNAPASAKDKIPSATAAKKGEKGQDKTPSAVKKVDKTQDKTPSAAKKVEKRQDKTPSAVKKGEKGQKKFEGDQKEDVFQAVLLVDNFGCSIFGSESPLLQEGLVPLANRKLIDYALESLTVSGVQEIFLYCSNEAENIRSHIQESKWSTLPECTISVIASEDALSMGDALRDFDAKGMLRNDFILMTAGVVTNLPLKPLLTMHRETVKKDKGAVMTLVGRKMLPGHRSRSKSDNKAFVVNSATQKLIAYDDKLSGKELHVPLERIGEEMDIYVDCVESGIAVCSSSVPPLFTDNFDFTSISDFLRGILINEEILGNSVYIHRVERGYANRVVDFDTFHGISCDVMQRWTYPVVPDLPFGSNPAEYGYNLSPNFIYKAENVKISNGAEIGNSVLIGAGTEVGKKAKITHSVLGDNCKIEANVSIADCHIGSNVIIKDGCKLRRCILASNMTLECLEDVGTDINNVLMTTNGEKFEIKLPTDGMEFSSDDDSDSGNEFASEGSGGFGDDDFKIFSTEVMDSLMRGYEENVATENLVLEINSSKYAYNMTFKEVTSGVCTGLLTLAPKLNSEFHDRLDTKVQWAKIKEVVMKLKNVLAHYVKTKESQKDLLEALEEYSTDNKYFRPMLVSVIHLLYDEEILPEESILKWYRNPSLYEASAELRTSVKKLIDWLETAESDSEEE